MAGPTHKTTTISSMKIACTTFNLPTGQTQPVLCFVHGWCCSSALWSAQEPLFTRHPSILIDLRGHGESDKPGNQDYSIEFFARAARSVLAAEGVSRVVLVAHSMGGVITTTFLRLYGTEMVKGIVYLSSFWLMPVHYLSSGQRRGMTAALQDDAAVMALFAHAWGEKSTPAIIQRVQKTVCEMTPMHVRLAGVSSDSLPAHWEWDEVYADSPVLQITYASAPEWDRQAKRHFPNPVTERWDAVSVFLMMEDGERLNQRVGKFLMEHQLT